jgi:hypothetical protein
MDIWGKIAPFYQENRHHRQLGKSQTKHTSRENKNENNKKWRSKARKVLLVRSVSSPFSRANNGAHAEHEYWMKPCKRCGTTMHAIYFMKLHVDVF